MKAQGLHDFNAGPTAPLPAAFIATATLAPSMDIEGFTMRASELVSLLDVRLFLSLPSAHVLSFAPREELFPEMLTVANHGRMCENWCITSFRAYIFERAARRSGHAHVLLIRATQ